MTAPRAYTRTHSLMPGELFVWCASFGADAAKAHWQIVRVTGFPAVPDVRKPLGGVVAGPSEVELPPTEPGPWNREEVGYGWPEFAYAIPADWPGGLYAAQFSGDPPAWEETDPVYFVVRPPADGPHAKILLCYPFSTTVAYAGGQEGAHLNLYDSRQHGRARRVSLDRPFDLFPYKPDKREYTIRLPFLLWQYIRGLPASPEVDVCTSFDLHGDPSTLDGYHLFVSAGHDEYWSWEMRDRVEGFVASGGNAAFFTANACWWQVRFEDDGRSMVCHKSGVEDPLAGVDGGRVTANWASSPTNRPENTLTGVSFRRGTMATSDKPYQVLAPSHPFLAGVTEKAFGNGLVTLENDGADYIDQEGAYVVTGRDGTPPNFQILAAVDLSTEPWGLRGRPTMGTFTNNGTVFTAASTDWAAHLDDPAVAKITQNVVTMLSVPATGPPWRLPARTYPTSSWTVLEHVGKATAICGVFQGRLLLAREGSVASRDAEDPCLPWEAVAVPSLPGLTALGSDLYTEHLDAGTQDGDIHSRTGVLSAPDSWEKLLDAPEAKARCLGIGAIHRPNVSNPLTYWFAAFQIGPTAVLYRCVNSTWVRLGPISPNMTAMTVCDEKLFAIQDGGLYCRETSPVDLVWTRIASAPENTFSLAAYLGRLFALAGTTSDATLYWRDTSPELETPFRAPSLLFCRGAELFIGRLAGNGDFETTGSGRLEAAYTHVTRANDGMALFYERSSGSGAICRLAADGSLTSVHRYPTGSFASWSHVSFVDADTGAEKVFFYDQDRAEGVVGHFDGSGEFVTEWSSTTFATGWTHVVPMHGGGLFFYNAGTGQAAWGGVSKAGAFSTSGTQSDLSTGWDVVVPAGSDCLFFYRSDGHAALAEVQGSFRTLHSWTDFSTGWTVAPASNGLVLFYDQVDGHAVSGGFSESGFEPLRYYPEGAFAPGSTSVVSLGIA
jgi:N,N-dimethylformamidase beta subunit-like, C-terminal